MQSAWRLTIRNLDNNKQILSMHLYRVSSSKYSTIFNLIKILNDKYVICFWLSNSNHSLKSYLHCYLRNSLLHEG